MPGFFNISDLRQYSGEGEMPNTKSAYYVKILKQSTISSFISFSYGSITKKWYHSNFCTVEKNILDKYKSFLLWGTITIRPCWSLNHKETKTRFHFSLEPSLLFPIKSFPCSFLFSFLTYWYDYLFYLLRMVFFFHLPIILLNTVNKLS